LWNFDLPSLIQMYQNSTFREETTLTSYPLSDTYGGSFEILIDRGRGNSPLTGYWFPILMETALPQVATAPHLFDNSVTLLFQQIPRYPGPLYTLRKQTLSHSHLRRDSPFPVQCGLRPRGFRKSPWRHVDRSIRHYVSANDCPKSTSSSGEFSLRVAGNGSPPMSTRHRYVYTNCTVYNSMYMLHFCIECMHFYYTVYDVRYDNRFINNNNSYIHLATTPRIRQHLYIVGNVRAYAALSFTYACTFFPVIFFRRYASDTKR